VGQPPATMFAERCLLPLVWYMVRRRELLNVHGATAISILPIQCPSTTSCVQANSQQDRGTWHRRQTVFTPGYAGRYHFYWRNKWYPGKKITPSIDLIEISKALGVSTTKHFHGSAPDSGPSCSWVAQCLFLGSPLQWEKAEWNCRRRFSAAKEEGYVSCLKSCWVLSDPPNSSG
jgi:hypothetical protein